MEKTNSPVRVVVCDSGPLIHLDEIGCLDLLGDFAHVLVPTVVWEGVSHHRPAALQHPRISLDRTAAGLDSSPELAAISRIFTLHPGELQALQLALERNVDLMLTDDTAARLAARHIGLPVHGTLGILLRSIRRGQRTKPEVIAVLRSLLTVSTLHIKQSLIDETIQAIEQRE